MSLEKINLRKLLQLFFADARQQQSLLLADIRNEQSKKEEDRDSGGDFYGPFWSDAKDHVAGRSDLIKQTNIRIEANKTRARLYPILANCFLEMWNEKMRLVYRAICIRSRKRQSSTSDQGTWHDSKNREHSILENTR